MGGFAQKPRKGELSVVEALVEPDAEAWAGVLFS